jgi:hypothetical protein
MLAHQVREAQSRGVAYISATAAGGPGGTLNGYYTWARLGFEGEIPEVVIARLPLAWQGARYVLDLMVDVERRASWRAHGAAFEGTFDLRSGSKSLAVLGAYTSDRGISI